MPFWETGSLTSHAGTEPRVNKHLFQCSADSTTSLLPLFCKHSPGQTSGGILFW